MNQAGEIRPGGRTARTRAAVLAAVIEELTDHGWDQLSVETVAQRAGFGTAAMLRHHFTRLVGTSPAAYRRTFRG